LIGRSAGEKAFDVANVALMTLACAVMLFPLWYVLVLSLNDPHDSQMGGIWFWPRVFTLGNYAYVLSSPTLTGAYAVTVLRTVLGSLYDLVITGLAAYFASKRYLPGRNAILVFLTIPLFIGGTLVTNYIIIAKLGLLNNFLVYILPTGFSMFLMIVMRTFINDLPPSLEESAKLDGAGYIRIFFRIVVPLCKPVIATVLLFNAVGHWLDFYTNLVYVSKKYLTTVQYLLFTIQRSAQAARDMGERIAQGGNASVLVQEKITPEAVKYATLLVTTLPILFVYPFFQKYFAKGLMLGAIKE
jgi:putative aldouronate transport system permease protein